MPAPTGCRSGELKRMAFARLFLLVSALTLRRARGAGGYRNGLGVRGPAGPSGDHHLARHRRRLRCARGPVPQPPAAGFRRAFHRPLRAGALLASGDGRATKRLPRGVRGLRAADLFVAPWRLCRRNHANPCRAPRQRERFASPARSPARAAPSACSMSPHFSVSSTTPPISARPYTRMGWVPGRTWCCHSWARARRGMQWGGASICSSIR